MLENDAESAIHRAQNAILAARLFFDQAEQIARGCLEACEDEVVAAIVSGRVEFTGLWLAPIDELSLPVLANDDGRWVLIFSAQETVEDIQARCLEMDRMARIRLKALESWKRRKRDG